MRSSLKILTLFLILGMGAVTATAQTDANAQLAQSYFWAAQEAYAAGNYQKALTDIEKTEKTSGQTGVVLLMLKTKSLHKLGRFADAKQTINQFYSYNPTEESRREMAPILIGINESIEKETLGVMEKRYNADIKKIGNNDYAQLIRLHSKAANQGIANAQYNLGFMYEHGRGVTQSDTEAVRWYRKAADQGHMRSQYRLGYSYDNGIGVTKSNSEAVHWYRKAANQGDRYSQYFLGNMYFDGFGVTQSDSEAVRWYRKAADQGDKHSQHSLGEMYEYGRGVTRSRAEAVRWYRKAAAQGSEHAENSLSQLGEK